MDTWADRIVNAEMEDLTVLAMYRRLDKGCRDAIRKYCKTPQHRADEIERSYYEWRYIKIVEDFREDF